MGKILGIDLGTTNSVAAVMEGMEPTVITTAEGSRLCPSVVGFTKTGERLVGHLAKRQSITNPDRTIVSIKRRMGSNFKVNIDGTDYTPQQISAMVLQKLRADAEAYLGEPIEKAVITVPAYFSDAQRQATKDAGTIAGLDVVRIINEPTAAALAYGMDKEHVHTVLVWDLGGGTFDVSILELGDGVFEVRATNGDTMLGGDDWDERITNYLAECFQQDHGIDLRKDRMALQRLREASEKAKIELSSMVSTNINLPFISMSKDGPVHMETSLTRAKMEEITADLFKRMQGPTRQALMDAKLDVSGIDRVLLVGGSTRMPAVQEMVRQIFNKEPHKGLNPDEVVAVGAAIQAGVLGGEVRDIVLLDVTPLSLGIETLGGVFTKVIDRNTTIPTSKTREFSTAVDNQATVDIKICQGERQVASENKPLGNFSLTGIQAAPKGVPLIEVTFDIDVNGILQVSAKEKFTGKQQNIVISGTGSLSKDEIDRMVKEAEIHAAEDKQKVQEQEVKNYADAAIFSAEKILKDADGKVPAAQLEQVRSGIEEVKAALAARNAPAAKMAVDNLTSTTYEINKLLNTEAEQPAAAEPEVAVVSEPDAEVATEGAGETADA